MHFNWRRIHRGTLAFCGCPQRNDALHHKAKKDNCNDKLMSMNAFSSTDGSKINYKYTIQMREIIMHLSGRKKNKYLLIAVLLKKTMSRQLKLIAKRFNKPPLFNLHNEMPKKKSVLFQVWTNVLAILCSEILFPEFKKVYPYLEIPLQTTPPLR